jgi:hypothetical protein
VRLPFSDSPTLCQYLRVMHGTNLLEQLVLLALYKNFRLARVEVPDSDSTLAYYIVVLYVEALNFIVPTPGANCIKLLRL